MPRDNALPDPDRSPVFVVGTGRSGTTLMRLMLNAHPRIYLTQEASWYLNVSGWTRRLKPSTLLERYMHSAPFAWLRVARKAVLDRAPEDLDQQGISEPFRAVMRAKADQLGKPRYGDKTPTHFAYLGRMLADFDDPRIIHMVRDPRGTVASLVRMPWAPGSLWLNSLYCDQQLRAVHPFAEKIHEVRLEDLLVRPEQTMRGVLDFIGEPWDDAVLDHEQHVPPDDVPPMPWFENARHNPVPRPGPPAWTREISPAWIRVIEQMNAFGMKRYGYLPHLLDREPGWLARACAVPGETFRILGALGRLRRIARRHRRRTLPAPQASMEQLLNVNPRAWTHYPGFEMPRVPPVA